MPFFTYFPETLPTGRSDRSPFNREFVGKTHLWKSTGYVSMTSSFLHCGLNPSDRSVRPVGPTGRSSVKSTRLVRLVPTGLLQFRLVRSASVPTDPTRLICSKVCPTGRSDRFKAYPTGRVDRSVLVPICLRTSAFQLICCMVLFLYLCCFLATFAAAIAAVFFINLCAKLQSSIAISYDNLIPETLNNFINTFLCLCCSSSKLGFHWIIESSMMPIVIL